MDRREYFETLATVVSGTQCNVMVQGQSENVKLGEKARNITIPEHGLGITALENIFDSMRLASPGFNDLAIILNLKDVPALRFFMQRMALYHECGHVRFTPMSMDKIDEVEFSIRNFYEDIRIESLLSLDFPELGSKFHIVNRALLSNARLDVIDVTYLQSLKDKLDGVNAITAKAAPKAKVFSFKDKAGYILFIASMNRLGIPNKGNAGPAVERAIQLIDMVEANPKDFHVVKEAAEEIYRMVKEDPNIQPMPIGPEESPVSDGQDGEGDDEGKDEDDGEDKDELTGLDDDWQQHLNELLESAVKEAGDDAKLLGIDTGTVKAVPKAKESILKLINKSLVFNTANILRQMKGAKKSYNENPDDEGYSLDTGEVIQFRAGANPDGKNMYYNATKDRPDYDMVLCVDRSGSMKHDGAMLNAMKATASMVKAFELVGINSAILAFDDSSMVVKDWSIGVEFSDLDIIYHCGDTSIARAIQHANEILEKRVREVDCGHRQAIILVSDGGDSSWPSIAIEIAKAHRRGVSVFYIGIGSGCESFVSCMAPYFRFNKSVIVENSSQIGKALLELAKAFIREA